ncbi:hypothetical protein [Mycolicibacterium baixiangningiae]|uniref:hypothetical protein n=1 Tax=Mycolicibacterium baixiangningiae TaxID=2761578 RepID=UPI001E331CC6|nr:hypothetical protein [Mycolicibacterium baixiangningiae]
MRTPDITLRQLRYFAVLGTELNDHRAAERPSITQPALSAATAVPASSSSGHSA